ncbi:MAG: cytochrome B6, partial [Ignavibacteria bacterium]|nr:cytochrome B6 [Ignavibacteria bacterium]
MNNEQNILFKLMGACIIFIIVFAPSVAFTQQGKIISSYGPTNQTETFDQIKRARMAVKSERAKQHLEMLNSRYDLSKKTTVELIMSGGKPIPIGPTANLRGVTWEQLNKMTPEQIKEKGIFPYKPLPFPDHAEGG